MLEQTYIKNHKYGIEERAKREYGLTNVFELAGYLLEDGTMLDFSCGGWERSQDHRNVGQFFVGTHGSAAKVKFMKRGNIRCMCSRSGYRFEFIKPPTAAQVRRIQEAYQLTRQYDTTMEFLIERWNPKTRIRNQFYDIEAFQNARNANQI